MKTKTVTNSLAVLIMIIVIMACYGWGSNVYQVAQSDYTTLEGVEIVRIVGIFVFPVGCVMGWI